MREERRSARGMKKEEVQTDREGGGGGENQNKRLRCEQKRGREKQIVGRIARDR